MKEYITQEQIDAAIQQHADPVATYGGLCAMARAIEAAAIQHYRDSLVAGVVLPEPDFKYQRYDDTPICEYYTADQLRQAIADALAKQVPQSNSFKRFIDWATDVGYDPAHTCNSDNGKYIFFNLMTNDLWEAWQAAFAAAPDPKEGGA